MKLKNSVMSTKLLTTLVNYLVHKLKQDQEDSDIIGKTMNLCMDSNENILAHFLFEEWSNYLINKTSAISGKSVREEVDGDHEKLDDGHEEYHSDQDDNSDQDSLSPFLERLHRGDTLDSQYKDCTEYEL